MVIDVHVHPGFYKEILTDEKMDLRKKAMGWDLMSPIPLELTRKQMAFAHVDKLVLLPLDLTTAIGSEVISNRDIKHMVDVDPTMFIGFASVDPHRKDALDVLDEAFETFNLKGLKLNPSKQKFYPTDPMMNPIYKKCIEHNKPIIFHSGLSWEPDAPMDFSKPLHFEDVAIKYPNLRFCLAHFGWPWIHETIALLLKYPNVYADTSLLYMDSPTMFLNEIFKKQFGEYWIEHNVREKILFGSNSPRFRTARMKEGIESISWKDSTKRMVLGGNAEIFMNGGKEIYG